MGGERCRRDGKAGITGGLSKRKEVVAAGLRLVARDGRLRRCYKGATRTKDVVQLGSFCRFDLDGTDGSVSF